MFDIENNTGIDMVQWTTFKITWVEMLYAVALWFNQLRFINRSLYIACIIYVFIHHFVMK